MNSCKIQPNQATTKFRILPLTKITFLMFLPSIQGLIFSEAIAAAMAYSWVASGESSSTSLIFPLMEAAIFTVFLASLLSSKTGQGS